MPQDKRPNLNTQGNSYGSTFSLEQEEEAWVEKMR